MTGSAWSDAVTAALVMAVDPAGTGIVLRGRAGPVRTRWLALLRAALPKQLPLKTCPVQIADSRLLGGLDLDATLRSGRPVAAQGLLADADGGIVVLAMAERMAAATAAHIAVALDTGISTVERDGLSLRMPARFGIVALDEGIDDEIAPASLRDRLAMHIDLDAIGWRDSEDIAVEAEAIECARERLAQIIIADDELIALCRACAALGVASMRTPMQAVRVACAAAALAGRGHVDQDDIALAARLVLAPRATILPPSEQEAPPPPPEPPQDNDPARETDNDPPPDIDRALDDVILAAAQAAIPADVLALLRAGAMRARSRGAGKAGAIQASKTRGRPAGTRRGELRSGGRLNLIETLRTAAPWQRLRRDAATSARIIVRPEDVRLTRFRQRSETATIFVVDASGSAALHRLAEAKGAVELLLADCYVRRDQVALIAFRGTAAEILLPPTRSLARAKRSLAGLPGGGGTPLAAGLIAAFALADSVTRKGQTPSVIVLTDGRANIARDGSPGRPQAEADATVAARALQAAGIASVLVDTSQRPGPAGAQLARDMGARYLPLPYADAATLSKAVRAVIP
jgi:magnesium chelatase subunit D